jgi:hypothetical protein
MLLYNGVRPVASDVSRLRPISDMVMIYGTRAAL